MLTVDIVSESSQSSVRLPRISIANIGRGAVTHYAVTVGDESEADARLLLNYPRWSEPILGLVARCLTICRERIESEQLAIQIEKLICTTSLVPHGVGPARTLETLAVERSNALFSARSVDESGKRRCQTFASATSSPATLLVEAICWMLWRVPELPLVPTALEVPIHRGAVAYVRLADIPDWARSAFVRFAGRRRNPVISGEAGEIFHARDWQAFLG